MSFPTFLLIQNKLKSGKNTFCDICAQNSRRFVTFSLIQLELKWSGDMTFYEFFDIFDISHTVVKTAKNTLSDICAQNSRRSNQLRT